MREKGVVGKFVEFFGPGVAKLPLADRATIANMAPEYGATCGFFPVDEEALNYLRLTGRDEEHIEVVEAILQKQMACSSLQMRKTQFTDVVEIDLSQN